MVTAASGIGHAAKAGRLHARVLTASLIASCCIVLGSSTDVLAQEPPCADCPPGPHWIHNPNCPPGGTQTNQVGTGATVGIDLNFDCIADTEVVVGGPANILVRGALDDSANFPGLRPMDGHLDVIDTEILAMSLTGSGVQVVAGAGLGPPPGLPPSRGAAAEQFGNPSLADSFFDVFVVITMPSGDNLYNWQPVHVQQAITCVMPDANFLQVDGCLPLYDAPLGLPGIHRANLVKTEHYTYPGCCRPDGSCFTVATAQCEAGGGTVVPSCLTDLDGDGRDDACPADTPECELDASSPTGCTDACPGTAGQQCLPSSYGCIGGGTCGVQACDCDCHIVFDAVGPSCQGGCPDGTPCLLSGSGAVGDPYTCGCTGTCCYRDDPTLPMACIDNVTAITCAQYGGSFHPGAMCTGAEACCLPNGTCEDMDPLCCADLGGTSGGFGSVCPDEVPQACCDAAGGCINAGPYCCQLSGGSPQGPGSNCATPGICGGGHLCEIPAGAGPWCNGLQATDCQDGLSNEFCWPRVASISADGTPQVDSCECISEGCGKMAVNVFPDGTFGYRCLDSCPDPTQPCVIFKNDNPTTSSFIHSSQIAAGDEIRCDCKPPPPTVCPLQSNTKICEPRQSQDCQGAADHCEPEVLAIGPNGQLIAERCECHFDDDHSCGGKIYVIELPPPNGTMISCDFNCPDPANEQCVIWRNNAPTGLISAPATAFAPGDVLWCDCDPFDTVCNLPQTTPAWCTNLQNTDCRDGLATEECQPVRASVSATGGVIIKECDCVDDDCRNMQILPDPAGATFRCVNQCPTPGTQCVIWRNGVPTTVTSIHSSQVVGEDIYCDCADIPEPTCEMPTQFAQWCDALQATDCLDGAAGDQCWPRVWSVTVDATGVAAPELRECDCQHECGPVTRTDHADGSFTYRCILPCPDTTQPCLIHRNGVATTASSIHSSQIVPGERITCDCKTPPVVCPLETGQKICEPLQALDCKDGVAGELCRPQKVYVDDNGQVHAKLCDCVDDNTGLVCGSQIWVIELPPPNGTQVSCDFNCPNDPGKQCVIFANGVSTGLISAPAAQFPGQTLYCDCAPFDDPLCPLTSASAPWCQALQTADCKDDGTGNECHPVLVSVNAAGGIDPRRCDCVGPECRRMTITDDPTGAGYQISCDNACPDPNENCVIHLDGVPTNISSTSSWQVIGHDVSCDCVEMACPLVQHWCYQRQTTECLGGTATDQCAPMVVSVTGPAPSGVDVRRCECAGDECGPVQITKQSNGVFLFRCIDLCPPGLECQIHKNGVTTGQTSILSPSVTVDEDVTCQCAPEEPTTCPMPPNMAPWCVNRPQDCEDGMTGDQCWPLAVTPVAGGTEVLECDCLPGQCGPVHITSLADGTEQYRCIYACPEADKLCHIHRDGVDTGLFTINSSMVAPGEKITCDCVDDMEPVCQLQPGQSLCAARQSVDCTNPATPSEFCKPTNVIIGNNGEVRAEKCDCLPDGPCGPVLFFPDPAPAQTGMLSCDANCPNTGQQCVIWRNGISTGMIQAHSTTFASGDSLICDCDPPPACPLPPNQPWCDARRIFDCKDGVAAEQCRPMVVTTTTAGTPHALECDCVSGGCGPVNITQTAAGFLFRCVQECPPGAKCYIHRNGLSAGVSVINANTVAPGEKITCDCVGSPTVCPLFTGEPDFCLGHNDDCQTSSPNENCRVKEITFDQFGNPTPLACDCYPNNGECGPVLLSPAPTPPGGWNISCDQLCPDPLERCVIWRNNVPTGLISGHSSQFAPGDKLSCGCDEVQPECKPTQDGTACTQCPTPGLECVPTLVQWSPVSGKWRILECGCTNNCHIQPPSTADTKPYCVGPCPNSPITLPKKCIKRKDPATGAWECRCVPIPDDLDPSTASPARKNRYLSMTTGGGAARGEEPGPTSAIRITMDSLYHPDPVPAEGPGPDYSAYEGQMRWVGPLGEYVLTPIPLTTFFAAQTECGANFEEYSGEFSAYGGDVVPDSSYSVQVVGDECADSLDEEECYSAPLVLETSRFGDIVGPGNSEPDGVANVLDIPAVVDILKDQPVTVGKARAQLNFNTPDPSENVTVISISYVVDAVKDKPWYTTIGGQPSGPCTCPSSVACDPTNSCTDNGDCSGGRKCQGGSCVVVDPCNRCTP